MAPNRKAGPEASCPICPCEDRRRIPRPQAGRSLALAERLPQRSRSAVIGQHDDYAAG